uniref:RING-type E3 ubiquitin transferase n=1 Tax=Leersia perrieri TaxID=77586 RepID=A0A0D9XU77_9ORYZ
MAAMQQKGRLPAGLHGGGHQNPAQQARRSTIGIQGGGHEKTAPAAVKSYQKQAVLRPNTGDQKLKDKDKREQERREKEKKKVQERLEKERKKAQERPEEERKKAQERREQERKKAQERLKQERKKAQEHLEEERKKVQERLEKERKKVQEQREKKKKKVEQPCGQDRKSSNGKVQFIMYETLDIDAAVSKPDKRLRGTGTVYSVYKSKLGAITIPNEGAVPSMEEFTQAVETFKTIQHPNLANLVGACTQRRVLIYELLPDGTLEDRLTDENQKKSFTWKDRVTVAAGICSALDYLHRNKPKLIIHDDLKPSNIHFGTDSVCKLTNFGVSSLLRSTKHVSFLEQVVEGFVQALKDTDASKIQIQKDVSGLGTILLQLGTGRSNTDGLRDFVAEELGDDRVFQGKSTAQKEKILGKVVDPELKSDSVKAAAARMLFLGLRCTDPAGKQCPNLASEVLPQIKSCIADSGMVRVHRFCF